MPLFRPEAVAEAAGDEAGEAVRWQPRYGASLLVVLLVLLPLLLWWLGDAEYVRRLAMPGVVDLSGSRVPVRVERPGRLAALHVEAGTRVRAGQRLAEVVHAHWPGSAAAGELAGLRRLQQADDERLRLTQVLDRHDREVLAAQIEDLDRRLRLQGERLRLADRRVELTARSHRRAAALREARVLTAAETERAEAERLAAALVRNGERLRQAELRGERGQRRLALARLPLAAALRAQDARLRALDRGKAIAALARQRRQRLLAPLAGTVAEVHRGNGAWLREGDAVVTLFRGRPPELVLLLDDRQRAELRAGDRVRVRFPGHTAERPLLGRGRVLRVDAGPSPWARSLEPAAAAAAFEARAGVTIPAAVQLAHGMQVEAEVELRRVPLWRRLARPVLSLLDRFRA